MSYKPLKVVLTGSSGRIGRAIHFDLCRDHHVLGIDHSPASSTAVIADITDRNALVNASKNADAIIHTAALHAPHVGLSSDAEFNQVNVDGTRAIIETAMHNRVPNIVFTSTTALYGHASTHPSYTTWITEQTLPQPKTIYHHTKLAAEKCLQSVACPGLRITVLRMSRCFPEPAPLMAAYRLHRGVDMRDVASAHRLALQPADDYFRRYNISFPTPFQPDDCLALKQNAAQLLADRCPEFTSQFHSRHWPLPQSIDRIYDSSLAINTLGWQPCYDYRSVLKQHDDNCFEVLPAKPLNQSSLAQIT